MGNASGLPSMGGRSSGHTPSRGLGDWELSPSSFGCAHQPLLKGETVAAVRMVAFSEVLPCSPMPNLSGARGVAPSAGWSLQEISSVSGDLRS